MSNLAALDTAEISVWLTRVAQTIDRSLREPERARVLADLRADVGAHVNLPVLAQLALLDDCLRVAHLAIEADGEIEPAELARVTDLVRVAAQKYFAVLPVYESFDEGAPAAADVARFLRAHRADPGAFGGANRVAWRGLQLVRDVAGVARNAAPLRDHERMLARVMDTVFAGRSTEIEQAARRRLKALFDPPAATGVDPRAAAFVREDGPEVFSSVAHGSHIHERDPFDAEAIHADVRDVVHGLVSRAALPAQAEHGHGTTLLVLGESGSGKTHLLRALRTQVHAQRLGYVGYLQMTAEVGDYTRYVLRALIDSMERPYDAPVLSESALMYLSDGLVGGGRTPIPGGELHALRTAELAPADLEALVGRIVDRVVRTEGLGGLDSDVVQALLLLQRRDPAIQRRVVKFLRCESLNGHDRQLLGGLGAREQPDDALRTIRQLALAMRELHMAALVIEVDQIEETVPDGTTVARLQQAFDALRAIADGVPSAVIVISCLDDVYDAVKPKLLRSLVDRLEHDPPVARLASRRQRDEIEMMLVRRLEYLYAAFDVPWRDDEPIYPFTSAQLDAVTQLRARDVIATFRAYHASCIAEREIVGPAVVAAAPAPKPVAAPAPSASLDRVWLEALAAAALPDDDGELLALLGEGVRGAATELAMHASGGTVAQGFAPLSVNGRGYLLAACNRGAQGGHLTKQLQALQARAQAGGMTAVAVRSGDWQFSSKTATSTSVGTFVKQGGRIVALADSDVRALAAMRDLIAAAPTGLAAWRADAKPLAQLALVRDVLGLGAVVPSAAPEPPRVEPAAPPPVAVPNPPIAAPAPVEPTPGTIRLGTTISKINKQSVALDVEQIKTHVAFLGSTGSGKTTAALSVVEQLLDRGISVLLVDRKGDLASYADEAWWSDASAPDAARRADLRAKIDIGLYTPGNAQGRPLRLPLIPPLDGMSAQEREQLARFAADGLAAMMGYGSSQKDKAKASVLQCAIELLEGHQVTIENLLETIDRPDPDLLRKVSSLHRHFASLSEDLQTLRIQRGTLLAGAGEVFDIGALLPPPGGRARLSIISTSALGEVNVIAFWISRLLVELSRLGRRRPSPTLQAVAFFDEADLYVPAMRTPPTKEPMFDLLKRSRSTGIGVLLATQNPGDLDYKARDTINTWLVGKISQSTAIGKLSALIGQYPNVAQRLAGQPTGHFFKLAAGTSVEVSCDRSLMQTVQRSEAEVAELASSGRA